MASSPTWMTHGKSPEEGGRLDIDKQSTNTEHIPYY